MAHPTGETDLKISIAIPTHEQAPATFMYDLASLCAFTAAHMPEGWELGLQMVTGTYIHSARMQLMQVCVEQKSDYILWLDSDMRFPREALVRLLQHQKPVVGINYSKRGIARGFVAIKEVGIPGKMLDTLETSTGLEEVEAMGFGCVLMRTNVVKDLPDPREHPWFQHKHMQRWVWMGEDVYFCELLRNAGIKLYVDHDLSKDCAHTGLFEFRPYHAEGHPEPSVEAEVAA